MSPGLASPDGSSPQSAQRSRDGGRRQGLCRAAVWPQETLIGKSPIGKRLRFGPSWIQAVRDVIETHFFSGEPHPHAVPGANSLRPTARRLRVPRMGQAGKVASPGLPLVTRNRAREGRGGSESRQADSHGLCPRNVGSFKAGVPGAYSPASEVSEHGRISNTQADSCFWMDGTYLRLWLGFG